MPDEWNPMPHCVAVRCPECRSEAKFEFAEVVKIRRAADVQFFQDSDLFEYVFFESTGNGRWHAAFYFHGLRTKGIDEIRNLPEGYSAENWNHGPYLYRSHGYDIGSVVCTACLVRKRHVLKWPEDAFFQIEHKGKVLWAFDRGTARKLLEFIASKDRKKTGGDNRFLRHIPSQFLQAGSRETLVRKLTRMLSP